MVASLAFSQLFKSPTISAFRTRSASSFGFSLNKPYCKHNINNTVHRTNFSTMSSTLFRLTPNSSIDEYLTANKEWATSANNAVLKSNASGQSPHTLWIGCSDSRCSEFAIKNLQPGEIFTHRNIANIINNPSDPSSKAILKFAINALKVKKILLAGHTKCGGADASLSIEHKHDYYQDVDKIPRELIDWLKPLIDLKFEHKAELDQIEDPVLRNKKLVQYNIKNQLKYLLNENEDVKQAVKEGRLEVHGLLYNVDTGLLELCE